MPLPSVARYVAGLMEGLMPEQIRELPPAERRRFADRCRQVADIADRQEAPKSGVLDDLRSGRPG